jgi:cytidyltransferase-like protein
MDEIMNLGQYIAQQLLEAEDKQTIALFPGAFKPPHKGHFEVVQQLLNKADQVVILVSPKTRDGVDADESVAVWNLYKTIMNGSVEVKLTEESPIREVYNVVKDNPDTNFILAAGKGEVDRFKSALQFPNVKVFDAGIAGEGVNATGLRTALVGKNPTEVEKFIPTGINVQDFLGVIEKPLAEINHQTTDDTFTALVAKEASSIERTAEKFNIPLEDLKYAFTAGGMVLLSDDIWSKLENSDSYNIKGEYSGELPTDPALVLNYDKNNYYLASGNDTLRKYKQAGQEPKVLLATIDMPNEKAFYLTEGRLNESQTATIGEFIKYSVKNLGLQNLPSNLTLSYDNDKAKEKRSFGYFDPSSNKIWVYVKNRNMADILRTLAHELIHRKQEEDGRLDINSGKTGSPIEDEANAMAGVLLRNFGKINSSIYEHKKMVKLTATKKNILKEVQQLPIGNSIIFGVEHYSESDAKQVVDYVKKNFSPDDKIAFMGEGGDDSNKYVAGSEQEMIYNELSSYFKNLVNDSWDGSDLNVMNDKSLLYKIQKEKTGLSRSKILAANWASMVGQNILQNQSVTDFAPEDYLSTEGIKFLKAAAQEAELPLSDNLSEPTAKDYDTLYRLSFPADYGDKYTKVAKVADAFNEARDENLLSKLKKYESKGYKVIATAGEGHINLIKAMLKK